jgi:curved DNA-binding protein CbpA
MAFPIQQGLFKYDFIDHYAILGVPLDADGQQIRERYLKIAYLLHPDTCKATTDREKQKANKLLSKLVNPAYEQLAREKPRSEYLLILSQIGQNLAVEGAKLTLASESAKRLAQAGLKIELVYKTLLKSLAETQYSSLDHILEKIAEISELNLVYLMEKQGQGVQWKPKIPTQPTAPIQEKPEEKSQTSPITAYIRRAQQSLDSNHFAQAIFELRDALKLDPNNSTCHALLGLAYLKQNQITMAKIHINKAWQANPKDPIAIKAKEELDKVIPADRKNSPSSGESGSGGIFGGLFGGKKK